MREEDERLNDKAYIRKALENIVSDFAEKKWQDDAAERERLRKQLVRKMFISVVVRTAVAVLVIVVLWGLTYSFVKNSVEDDTRIWTVGEVLDSDYRISGCIRNMWYIRSTIDKYYAANKRLPSSADELYAAEFLGEYMVCPASGRKYVFTVENGKAVFACPEPEKHGVKRIWSYVRSGPPVIER